MQNCKVIPPGAHWASVTLTTDRLPDEIVAVAASFDDSLKYGSQTPFSDQLASLWAGGHWQYDALHDSIITAGNGGTKPTLAAFTLFYNQGTQKYQLQQALQPGEQMWMDIGKLIRENIPDKDGKTLPADLTTGSYELRDLTNKGVGTLFEGKVIYDKTYGHVVYGCAACCGWANPALWYNPIGVPFQGSTEDGVTAWYPCESEYDDISSNFYSNWSSNNTSVATVDTYGFHTGVAVGSTTSQTHGYYQTNNAHERCPNLYCTPSGGVNTTPVISSISPTRGLINATTQVTINGNGLLGGHINTPAAIQVQNITTATNTQIVFDAVIASTAETGNNAGAIYVTVSGQDSNKEDFYVQVPTTLNVLSSQVISMSSYCVNPGTNVYGILLAIHYQVLDQATPATAINSASMEPQEEVKNLVVSGFSNGDPVPNWNDIGPDAYPATSKVTDANGQYWDAPLGICWPSGFTSFSVTQTVTVLVGGTRYPVSGNARTNNWSGGPSTSPGTGNITNGNDVSQSH